MYPKSHLVLKEEGGMRAKKEGGISAISINLAWINFNLDAPCISWPKLGQLLGAAAGWAKENPNAHINIWLEASPHSRGESSEDQQLETCLLYTSPSPRD